ncbi:MAG: asparagine synthase (glutamine-hydrolyzing) [Firmicutes bacterium]|nr:asparagine synthase (glutamine-hydrolyzing) [Bacillota bacterium]
MCGITGFVNKKDNKDKIIKKMADKIAHRGPDGEGYYINDNVALAHRRLSIIDLSTGSQPMFNANKDLVIVFNGEIYNYLEIKDELKKDGYKFLNKSDTEVIINGYKKWGKKVVDHLRGMYAFAIYDIDKDELFMARDKWGIKPLYYAKFNDTFMFASEIKALLEHPDFKKELNEDILSAYLCFNSCPTEETFFKGVYRLEPGHTLFYKNGNITIEKFFQIDIEPKEQDWDKMVNDIREAMDNSVKYHQISDVEVGSFLSSGIDSSYLVSLARPDKTYTVGYKNKKYDEISYAKDLTDKLKIHNKSKEITKEEYVNNFEKIIYYMDEPLADPSAIALYFVAQIASKDVKVVMSGEGADEFFGGYGTYLEDIKQNWYMKIPYFLRHTAYLLTKPFGDVRGFNFVYRRGQHLEDYNIGLGRVFRDEDARKIVKLKNQIHTRDIVAPLYLDYKGKDSTSKRQVIDYYYWLVKDFLHAVDRNTMMFSLEARTPFLDDKVYEVARHLPFNAKINNVTTKPALREAAKSVIPNESYKKKKLGFPVPLREWIREDDLYNKIRVEFESDNANKFFKQDKILKLLELHKNKKKDTYKKVWTIYTFLVWYRIYFN